MLFTIFAQNIHLDPLQIFTILFIYLFRCFHKHTQKIFFSHIVLQLVISEIFTYITKKDIFQGIRNSRLFIFLKNIPQRYSIDNKFRTCFDPKH